MFLSPSIFLAIVAIFLLSSTSLLAELPGNFPDLSPEYRDLVSIYRELINNPPNFEKSHIQALVVDVNDALSNMPIDESYNGLPHKVIGARLALRIANVMAHRHSFCQDARDITLQCRQAYNDWAAHDSSKQAVCDALGSSLDSQSVSLQIQPDGTYPPPPPPEDPQGQSDYEVVVDSILGKWKVSVDASTDGDEYGDEVEVKSAGTCMTWDFERSWAQIQISALLLESQGNNDPMISIVLKKDGNVITSNQSAPGSSEMFIQHGGGQ